MSTELVAHPAADTLPTLGTLDVERIRRFVITQQGKDYVQYPGLVDALHQVSGGCFSIETRIEQLPTADNGQLAVCSALVRIYAPPSSGAPDLVLREATGIGDASPGSVGRLMATAILRMAETRAKARALRDLLNVGLVAEEELGESDRAESRPPAPAPRVESPPPPAVVDRITIGDKAYTRPEVLRAYKQRLRDVRAAGLSVPETDLLGDDAPLPALVGVSQEWRRRLEARTAEAPQAS